MASLPFPFFKPVDGNGIPYAGAKLNFYRTGTSTRQNTYTTSALSSAHANPVVADSNGLFPPIYLGTSYDYEVILTDSSDVVIPNYGTIDPLFATGTSGRTAVNDAGYAATISDRTIAYTALSAARTVTLPTALAYPAGTILTIIDESGSGSSTATLSIAPAGADTINGLNTTQVVVSSAYGSAELESDGTSKWTVVRNTAGRRAVADAAATITARDTLLVYTSFTAARTVTLPAASAVPGGHAIDIVDGSGSASFSQTSGSIVGISLAPNGTDTIAGSNTTQVIINIKRGRCRIVSNGSNGWDVLAWAAVYRNVLVADVPLNNAANFFDGPSVAQGSVGTWRVSGNVTYVNAAALGTLFFKLWDGTSVISSAPMNTSGLNLTQVVPFALSGVITTPAGNLRISAKDTNGTAGVLACNSSGAAGDCTITAERIA